MPDSNETISPRDSIQYASNTDPPEVPPPSALPEGIKWRIRLMVVLAVVFQLIPILYCLLTSLGAVSVGRPMHGIKPWVGAVVADLAVIGGLLMLGVFVILLYYQRILRGILVLMACVISVALILIGNFSQAINQWTTRDTLIIPGGPTYMLLGRQRLMGKDYVIAINEKEGFFYNSYMPVGYSSNGKGAVVLIRPEPPADVTPEKLFVDLNGRICAFGGHCFLAYDPAKNLSFSDKDVDFSPWFLMDDTSPIHMADENVLIHDPYLTADSKWLFDALNHSNPNVRESAGRVMGALKIPIPASQPVLP